MSATVDLSQSDHPLQLQFSVTNPNPHPITVLKRDSPLEGLRTNMFAVRNPGEIPIDEFWWFRLRRVLTACFSDGDLMSYRGKVSAAPAAAAAPGVGVESLVHLALVELLCQECEKSVLYHLR